VRRTVAPSAEIEEQIDRLLAVGVGENPRESLAELAKLGARLIIQRAEPAVPSLGGASHFPRQPGDRLRPARSARGSCPWRCRGVRPGAEPRWWSCLRGRSRS
jgi:hypothetical protein